MINLTAFIIMGLVVVYQGIVNYLERKNHDKKELELINRLMSRDYTDYVNNRVYMKNANSTPSPQADLDALLKMEAQENWPVGN